MFRALALRYEGRVAFLGVDALDERAAAERFLARQPTPYPHVEDPDGSAARLAGGGRAWPTTSFYTADGRLEFVHQGAYPTARALEEAIVRYALGGADRGGPRPLPSARPLEPGRDR